MKILFIYSYHDVHSEGKPLREPTAVHFGLSYISSFLKAHGHQTSLVVLGRPLKAKNTKTVKKGIAEFSPDLVGFTAVASEYSFILEMARYIRRRYPCLYQLIGGGACIPQS